MLNLAIDQDKTAVDLNLIWDYAFLTLGQLKTSIVHTAIQWCDRAFLTPRLLEFHIVQYSVVINLIANCDFIFFYVLYICHVLLYVDVSRKGSGERYGSVSLDTAL